MSASTFTTRTPDFLNDWKISKNNDQDEQIVVRKLLDTLIKDHHDVFHIVYRDQPNVLARVLVALHELGASRAELVQGYYNVSPTLVPLLSQSNHYKTLITPDTWQSHLGDTSYYQAYLAFFSDQTTVHGIDAVVETFFIHGPLSSSIGGRLQPLVHLTFGVEYAMPHIVAQALAYLATTHLDVSVFIMDYNDNSAAAAAATLDPTTVLFDQVAADPRFAGRMEVADMAAYKVLLKSQGPLLRTYMSQCTHPTPTDLIQLTTDLVSTWTIRLAVSSQLLDAARSIDFWPAQLRPKLSLLVLLATFCTFIVERRPAQSSSTAITDTMPTATATATTKTMSSWQQCADRVKAIGNPTHILLFQNLVKISKANKTPDRDLLGLANRLVVMTN